MRITFIIFSIVAIVGLSGCAHDYAEELSWSDRTNLPRGDSVGIGLFAAYN
jgi:hypothetical protein